MNYLQLPPEQLKDFAEQVKKDCGLIIVERKASVRLDESKYASGWVAWDKTYKFSLVNKDGQKEHITIQNGDGSSIYAVTKKQYNGWKNCYIVSEPLGWDFGRILCCMAQLSYKYNLINPAADLYKLQYLWRRLFNGGKNNGQEE